MFKRRAIPCQGLFARGPVTFWMHDVSTTQHFVDPAGNLQVTNTLEVSNPAGIQGFEMSRSTWTGPRGYVSVYGLGRQLSSQVPTLPTEYAASLEVRSTFEDSPGCEPLDRTTSV